MSRKRVERNISYDDIRRLYYVSMDMGKDEMGRRVKQYRTFRTLPAARAGLKEFLSNRDQAKRITRSPITLSQWLEYWMEAIVRPSRAETTSYAYQKMIDNHMDPLLGDIPLSKLSPRDIQQYYLKLQRDAGLSPNTLRRHHAMLSASLRSAVQQDMLTSSPMDRVVQPRSTVHETSFYTQEELKELYELVDCTSLAVPVHLAGSLGLRREEICGLKWEHVAFNRRVLYIREARTAFGANIVQKETKNRSSTRSLFIPEALMTLLSNERSRQIRCRQNESGYVVLDPRGDPYSPNALSLAFGRFVRENDLPHVTLHGLRHTFATIASFQGATLFDIGKALGHATPAVTGKIYTHLIEHTHESTIQMVSNALKDEDPVDDPY